MQRNLFLILILLASVAPSAAAQSPAARDVSPGTELLRPGDVVQLRIWREPDLSGEFPVDEAGKVVFPKIGQRVVVDESPEMLREKLVKAYEQYLRNPSIDIVFLRRVTVLGAVRKPGVYPVSPTMTIADVLAVAGGTTPEGQADNVELIRAGNRLSSRVTQNTRVADSPIRSGDQLFVPERRWISRNSGLLASVISAVTSLAVAVIVTQ